MYSHDGQLEHEQLDDEYSGNGKRHGVAVLLPQSTELLPSLHPVG